MACARNEDRLMWEERRTWYGGGGGAWARAYRGALSVTSIKGYLQKSTARRPTDDIYTHLGPSRPNARGRHSRRADAKVSSRSGWVPPMLPPQIVNCMLYSHFCSHLPPEPPKAAARRLVSGPSRAKGAMTHVFLVEFQLTTAPVSFAAPRYEFHRRHGSSRYESHRRHGSPRCAFAPPSPPRPHTGTHTRTRIHTSSSGRVD